MSKNKTLSSNPKVEEIKEKQIEEQETSSEDNTAANKMYGHLMARIAMWIIFFAIVAGLWIKPEILQQIISRFEMPQQTNAAGAPSIKQLEKQIYSLQNQIRNLQRTTSTGNFDTESIKALNNRISNFEKQIVILCILVLGFNYSYGKVLNILEIPNTSIREMLSIPFQQTARYVKYHSADVTEKEKKNIDKILNYDTLAERYNPILSDKVKNEYNKYATNDDLKNYFESWLNMLFKHPMTYINATVSNVYGYFYPDTYRWYVYNTLNEKLPEAGFDYHFIDTFEIARDLISEYSSVLRDIPIVKLIVNCGFYTWCYLFLMVVLL